MIGKSVTTIWEFPVQIKDTFEIEMPRGALILDFQMQGPQPMLWALVNPAYKKDTRYFRIIGTGDTIPKITALDYIGTIQDPPFVWHLFEEVE